MLRKLANTFIIRDKVGAGVSISIGAALICLSVFFRGDYSIAGRVFFIAMGLSQILFAIAGLFPDRKGQLKFSFQVVGLL